MIGRAGYGGIVLVFRGEKSLDKLRQANAELQYPGNAPPMRALPFGLADSIHDLIYFSRINSNSTHPHPKSFTSSFAVACALRFMLSKSNRNEFVIKYIIQQFESLPQKDAADVDQESLQYFTKLDALPPFETVLQMETFDSDFYEILCGDQPTKRFPSGKLGLPCDAMRTAGVALYLAKYAKDAMEGLRHAVMVGGDVGTLAPIVTGILGARYGLGSVPKHLQAKIENVQELRALSKRWFSVLFAVPNEKNQST
eukprot:TRINITY_DN11724_c0_g1_i1.p1 TRINITY_DN11724_c0_g1~~TRINITY_DN11724_c0_g1_i1.p1  ORF type:complete len:255 (+),score=33.57 TRINITY_DN11724_c0_g1_i1:307-1071(+)